MVTQGAGDPRTYAIIGAAMEVHNQLGRGFLEQGRSQLFWLTQNKFTAKAQRREEPQRKAF